MRSLAWNWLGTVLALVIIFMVRGALEVVSYSHFAQSNSPPDLTRHFHSISSDNTHGHQPRSVDLVDPPRPASIEPNDREVHLTLRPSMVERRSIRVLRRRDVQSRKLDRSLTRKQSSARNPHICRWRSSRSSNKFESSGNLGGLSEVWIRDKSSERQWHWTCLDLAHPW